MISSLAVGLLLASESGTKERTEEQESREVVSSSKAGKAIGNPNISYLCTDVHASCGKE